jgi:hypothetical protein
MITKTNFWESVRKELKELERSKVLTQKIMTLIKDIDQSENKKVET